MKIEDIQFKSGDWMECRSNHFISKLIRLRCKTATNHGQPLHFKDGEWYVLDQEFPRMVVTKLSDEIANAKKKEFDYYICRQAYEVPGDNYEKAALKYETKIAKERPFYALWDLLKFLFTLPKLKKVYNDLVKEASIYCSNLDMNVHTMSEDSLNNHIRKCASNTTWVKFCTMFDENVRGFYYCTEHWKNIWITEGTDVFKELYNVDYCTPIEAEKFSREHCIFLSGCYNGEESDQLWKMIQKE